MPSLSKFGPKSIAFVRHSKLNVRRLSSLKGIPWNALTLYLGMSSNKTGLSGTLLVISLAINRFFISCSFFWARRSCNSAAHATTKLAWTVYQWPQLPFVRQTAILVYPFFLSLMKLMIIKKSCSFFFFFQSHTKRKPQKISAVGSLTDDEVER